MRDNEWDVYRTFELTLHSAGVNKRMSPVSIDIENHYRLPYPVS